MTRIARVFKSSGSHSRKSIAVTAAVTVAFLALLGSFPGAAGQGLAQVQGLPGQNSNPLTKPLQQHLRQMESMHFPRRSQKQKQALLNYNFKQMKKHASDLAELAKSLQKEIEKTNEDVLSLEIVKKAKKIQKLAKKIENEAKGG